MERVKNQFFKYVIPSMFAMLLTGFYAIVDGFFVGRATGDIGLAGINIAWPITALILAAGTGIGTGGAVLMSMRRGEGKLEEAGHAKGNTFVMLIAGSIVLTALLKWTYPAILRAFGAQGEIYKAAAEYIDIIVWGCTLQILGAGISPVIRNDGKTIHAMVMMVAGLIVNIILDAWFVMGLDWGLKGAALATITAQGVVALLGFLILATEPREDRIRLSWLKPNKTLIVKLMKIGISPFGMSLAPSIIIILNNWQCLAYGGDNAVAAYAVVSYIISSVQLLLAGVGDGIQPLISFYCGAKQYQIMNQIRNRGIFLSVGLGLILTFGTILTRKWIPVAFGTSVQTGILIESALVISSISFVLIGLVRLSSSYFYACGKSKFSLFLIYGDPVVFTPVLLILLPMWFGIDGIWNALPAAQGILAVLLIPMYRSVGKQQLKEVA